MYVKNQNIIIEEIPQCGEQHWKGNLQQLRGLKLFCEKHELKENAAYIHDHAEISNL